MRHLLLFVVGIFILASCKEEVKEHSFRMKAEGFSLEADPDPEGVFEGFDHMIYGGIITFEGDQGSFIFDLRGQSIEGFEFRLPEGEYLVKAGNGPALLYGQGGAAFSAEPFSIRIDEQTDTISIKIEADCALVLVYDEFQQLDYGAFMIERHSFAHGFFKTYPLTKDEISKLYYAYFQPDPDPQDPSAFIWFFEGEPGAAEGGIATYKMEIGKQYHIKILE